MDFGFVEFIVKDDRGNTFADQIHSPFKGGKTQLLTVAPNDSEFARYDLLAFYGVGDQLVRQYSTKTNFPPGGYSITGRLFTGTDTIQSNAVQISIENPKGTDLEAYRLLDTATESEFRRDYANAVKALEKAEQNYPGSAYADAIWYQELYIPDHWPRGSKDNAIEFAKRYIDAHPAGEMTTQALSYILTHSDEIGDKMQINREELRHISDRYPGTRIGKRAKVLLRDVYK